MKKINTDSQKVDEILERGTIVEILPSKEEFKKALLSGKKMRFYIGFDPTSPTLHLSHAKNLMLMEKFRQLGHEVIILFGDFTARIGDPSGQTTTRRQLTEKEIEYNVKQWKKLVNPLINLKDPKNPAKIKYNSIWLSRLRLGDILHLASYLTVPRLLERDMFQKRLEEGKTIFLHEFLYPLLQGYDSVALDVDVEVCGTDQIFNAMVGRDLLKKLKNKEKFVVAVTLMENPKTGELMSKSKGIGVFLDAKPNDMYGQIMAQPDEMIEILFVNNTYLSLPEIKKIVSGDPWQAKSRLAFEIVKIYYGEKKAKRAQEEFNRVFSQKKSPSVIPEYKTDREEIFLPHFLRETKLVKSAKEAKRLIEEGAIEINEKIHRDWRTPLKIKGGEIIKVGKRRFIKIIKK